MCNACYNSMKHVLMLSSCITKLPGMKLMIALFNFESQSRVAILILMVDSGFNIIRLFHLL